MQGNKVFRLLICTILYKNNKTQQFNQMQFMQDQKSLSKEKQKTTNSQYTKKKIKLPTIHEKASFNQIYVKGQRPLAVYIKHAKKVLQKSNILFIHGMTSAIVKALKLTQVLRKQFPYLKYEIESNSVPTIVKSENQQQYQMRERSCIHIRLEKNFTGQKKPKQ